MLSRSALAFGPEIEGACTMVEFGPLPITAMNRDQAEYLIRSRAEQRGVEIHGVDVAAGGPGFWFVTVTIEEGDAAKLADAALNQDTQVRHVLTHPPTEGHPDE